MVAGIETFDESKRAAIYHRIDRILIDNVPEYILDWLPQIASSNTHIQNVRPSSAGSDLWKFMTGRSRMVNVRRLATAAVVVVAIALIAVAAGLIYNEASIASLRAQTGVRGRLYDVSGHRMHLYCSGSGEPTLVLSAGLGDDSLVFARLQAALSPLTRVCSYDRAGLGWSDSRPAVPDSQNVAAELHELLHQANISAPIVLAGHSMSGVHIRAYAERYENDLAGLVFFDGSTPLQDPLFPPVYAEIDRQRRSEVPRELAMMALGIDRLQGNCAPDLTGGVAAYARWLDAVTCVLGPFMQAPR